jgi:hypothetical protein
MIKFTREGPRPLHVSKRAPFCRLVSLASIAFRVPFVTFPESSWTSRNTHLIGEEKSKLIYFYDQTFPFTS